MGGEKLSIDNLWQNVDEIDIRFEHCGGDGNEKVFNIITYKLELLLNR